MLENQGMAAWFLRDMENYHGSSIHALISAQCNVPINDDKINAVPIVCNYDSIDIWFNCNNGSSGSAKDRAQDSEY